MLGSEHFLMGGTRVEDEPARDPLQLRRTVLRGRRSVPPRVDPAAPAPDEMMVEEWLTERRGGRCGLLVPQRGNKRQLVEMVAKSATDNLEQNRLRWLSDEQKLTAALTELADALALPSLPRRIECFDISTLQGTNTVASMVVFVDGKPNKSDYRRFSIKGVEGQNDLPCMQEVIRRRFKRPPSERRKPNRGATLPDLVIIDGGKGQLNAAMAAIDGAWCRRADLSGLPRRTRRSSCLDIPRR